MVKKAIEIAVILLFALPGLKAQKPKVLNNSIYDDKPIHFGFTIGLNTLDYNISNNRSDTGNLHADVYQLWPGFHVQVVSSLKLSEHFNLRFLPGMSFGQRNIDFVSNNELYDTTYNTSQINADCLEFPLLIKYRGKRINNFSPYLIGGVNTRYNLAAKKNYKEDDDAPKILVKPLDFAYEIGIGIDFYLPYFKLGTELKMSRGLVDIMNHKPNERDQNYVSAIDKITSNMIMLSFHFE